MELQALWNHLIPKLLLAGKILERWRRLLPNVQQELLSSHRSQVHVLSVVS